MKIKNNTVLSFTLPLINKYRTSIVLFFLSMAFIWRFCPLFVTPYILKIFGDKYQIGTLTTTNAIVLSFFYVLFFSIAPLLRMLFIEKRLCYGGLLKMENDFKKKLFNHVIQHSVKYYDDMMSGTIAKKIEKATLLLSDTFGCLATIISAFIVIIISLIVYLNINLYISIVFIVWSVLFLSSYYYFSKLAFKAGKQVKIEQDNLSGLINDDMINISNIKTFTNQPYESQKRAHNGNLIIRKVAYQYKINAISRIINGVLSILLMFCIIGISFYLTFKKEITIGTFIFICQNIVLLQSFIQHLYEESIIFIKNYSEIKNSFENLLQKIEIQDKDGAGELELKNGGKIVFKNLTFSYLSSKN